MSAETKNFDVIIIGGGPAGLSAALWCVDLGLTSILIDKQHELGGQLLWTFNKIKNYLGCEAENGRELAERFTQHIENAKVKHITGCEVVSADLENKIVELADGRSFSSKTIVIATGVRRRKLGVPGEDEFVSRGVLDSGAKSKDAVVGKTVVIVGGGDSALENALILAESAAKVIVIHRQGQFSARGDFVERASSNANIAFVFDAVIEAIKGDVFLERVEVISRESGEQTFINADLLLVRIGVEPNTELFSDQIELDSNGYVIVDQDHETSRSDVFAIGDITNLKSLTINSAVGSGVTAIKAISWRRQKRTKI